jgi:uncharacterized protein (TIGR02246 family)
MLKTTVFLLAVCSLLLPVAAFAQLGSDSDREAIREVVIQFVETWNSHDAHAFAEVFAEDADFTNWRGTGASGRPKIEEFHAPLFATIFKASTLKYSDIKTRFLRPDVAAVDVRWGMTGATDAQGNALKDREGLLDFVMMKDTGKWAIAVMHNLDLTALPPPPK